MPENDHYLAPCPKCGKKDIRIFTVSHEVVCSDCGYAVDISPEDIYRLYAKQWNQKIKYYALEKEVADNEASL